MRTNRCFSLLLAATSVAALAGCGGKKPRHEAPVPVTVTTVSRQAAPDYVVANGTVEPLQTVSVESQVGGVLQRVAFREGDDVKAGQPLFYVDPRPYRAALQQAEANLARDRAQAVNSERDAQRYRALVAEDYVTQAQADQADATAAAQAAVVRADSAALENARLNLGYTVIRAPIAGRTGSLLVHEGNLVKPGSGALVVINQIRPILVRFSVPERYFPQIQKYGAQALPVTATPAADSADPVQGQLSFVNNQVDQQTGTLLLKARFQNRRELLWPGEFVTTRLRLFVQKDAVVIPSAAVVTGQSGSFVFVVDKNGTAEQRTVTVGRAVDGNVIIDGGLKPGERIVTDGQSRLSSGSRVEVRKGTP